MSAAQKGVTTFGICIKPIIPSTYFRTGTKNYADNGIQYSISQKTGFSAGGLIRAGISKTFSFETGIMFAKRNYDLSITDTSFVGKSSFKVIAYEIPLNAIATIQLDEKFFMSSALGLSLDILPSDIYTADPNDKYFRQYSARNQKFNAALNANLGAEYRTKKSGILYAGFSYHRSFSGLFTTIIEYYPNRNYDQVPYSKVVTELQGDYFTIDFRYYFHEDPLKKKKKKN
ncbi:hypothetical protein BH11BAC2_BH11BAC2_13620 [soil metagenome]